MFSEDYNLLPLLFTFMLIFGGESFFKLASVSFWHIPYRSLGTSLLLAKQDIRGSSCTFFLPALIPTILQRSPNCFWWKRVFKNRSLDERCAYFVSMLLGCCCSVHFSEDKVREYMYVYIHILIHTYIYVFIFLSFCSHWLPWVYIDTSSYNSPP